MLNKILLKEYHAKQHTNSFMLKPSLIKNILLLSQSHDIKEIK